jgi:hypothetical protein
VILNTVGFGIFGIALLVAGIVGVLFKNPTLRSELIG